MPADCQADILTDQIVIIFGTCLNSCMVIITPGKQASHKDSQTVSKKYYMQASHIENMPV
jgi:hypothetical protein